SARTSRPTFGEPGSRVRDRCRGTDSLGLDRRPHARGKPRVPSPPTGTASGASLGNWVPRTCDNDPTAGALGQRHVSRPSPPAPPGSRSPALRVIARGFPAGEATPGDARSPARLSDGLPGRGGARVQLRALSE